MPSSAGEKRFVVHLCYPAMHFFWKTGTGTFKRLRLTCKPGFSGFLSIQL